MIEIIKNDLLEHINTFNNIDLNELIICAQDCINALKAGHKILIFGNGGSAADAQHFAAELSGRYLKERAALAAIALSTDTSAITAISNDYGFNQVFARQVAALAKPGDICIGISTSGSSENVLKAFETAKDIGCTNWLLTSLKAPNHSELAKLLKAPSTQTPRIQEAHIFYLHSIARLIDEAF